MFVYLVNLVNLSSQSVNLKAQVRMNMDLAKKGSLKPPIVSFFDEWWTSTMHLCPSYLRWAIHQDWRNCILQIKMKHKMSCLRFSVCGWVDNFVNDNCSSVDLFFWQEVGHCPQHCAVLSPSLMCVLGSPTTAHSLWISAQIEHQCNHAYFSNPRFSLFPRTEAPHDAINQPRLIYLFHSVLFGTAVS